MKRSELEIVKVKVESLVPYAKNAKKHPEDQIRRIAKSIKELCEYCYVPACRHQRWEDFNQTPSPRQDIVRSLAKELGSWKRREQVLLSFIGDPYCTATDGNQATADCLALLRDHRMPAAVLTKGGYNCLKDLSLFQSFHGNIQVGATLTFDNDRDSKKWEAGAASPQERIDVLRELHSHGVKTFASFEPVIAPGQSLHLMEQTLDCVDAYKIGKINRFKGIDKTIDWTRFLKDAVRIMRQNNKTCYIKHDLRECAKDVDLLPTETDADALALRWEDK